MIFRHLFILLILVPSITHGQETKQINDKKTDEVYYVLKSDSSIKHGNYQKMTYKGTVLVNGYYSMGIKDSIWEFYNYDGTLQQKFNFRSHKLIYNKQDKWARRIIYRIISGSDTLETTLEKPPVFIGGSRYFIWMCSRTIKYPQAAVDAGISGTVYISFVIDENGKASNFKVKRGIGYGIDEEALRAAKLICNDWVPAINNGKTVKVESTLPMKFTLR